MESPRVLVIDDDPEARLLVRAVLERSRMKVLEASSAVVGLREIFSRQPALVILDLAMPGMDGWTALGRIREMSEAIPVLVLSGRDHAPDRVRCLEAGADDFLGKPFAHRELAARVNALLRRAHPRGVVPERRVVDTGWVRLDPVARRVFAGGAALSLTPLEYRLLSALCREPGAAVSSVSLVGALWGHVADVDASGPLTVVVSRLRSKLGKDPRTGSSPVETVRGFGYRLAMPEAGEGAGTPASTGRDLMSALAVGEP